LAKKEEGTAELEYEGGTMKTLLKDWYLVSTVGNERVLSKNLWGVAESDTSGRYYSTGYIFSSKIRLSNIEESIFVTKNGTLYRCVGEGKKISIDLDQFLWLRAGNSPMDLFFIEFNCSSS
jgi:hypothetical protein